MKFNKKVAVGVVTTLFVTLGVSTICNADTATVDTDTLNLRKEASTSSSVLRLLNQGEKLDVLEEVEGWYKVKTKNNITGFVSKDYVKVEKTESENKDQEEPVSQEPSSEENNIDNTTKNNENTKQDKKEFEVKESTLRANTEAYILPLINSSKLASLNKGLKVTLVDETNNWYYIQTEQINAWVPKTAVEQQTENNTKTEENKQDENKNEETVNNNESNTNTETQTKTEQEETAITRKTMYVNSASIYVRKGPGTEYEYVDTLVLNNSVTVTAEIGEWYKVEVAGNTGYIAKRLLSSTKQDVTNRGSEERKSEEQEENSNTNDVQKMSSKGEEIVEFAKQYLGCKYVYGGSGPSTFDCSGFTMFVYKNFGVSLSHSARAQSKNGVYVEKQDLQPGDLVFFKDYETMEGIGHCGIYIGNGEFIHASSGTGYCVKISTLLTGSYNTRYETARRVI